jgi:hypothetical protein
MKKIVLVLLLITIMISCSSNDKKEASNMALVESYIDAVEDLDYDTMASLLDDKYYGYGPSYGDSISKAQAVEKWKFNTEAMYESVEYVKSRTAAFTLEDGDNSGDWVSNWAELHIVDKNGLGELTIWANTVYKIENNKIVKSYTFYNEADALRQLDYVFINFN